MQWRSNGFRSGVKHSTTEPLLLPVRFCNWSLFCCALLYAHSSFAIVLTGKRELFALLNLSSWCLVMVERLILAVPWLCLQFVIVVFPDHTHLLFLRQIDVKEVTHMDINVGHLSAILALQSSWWGRESCLLCLVCLPGISRLLCGSSSRCHGFVCSLWLLYFLIILTYYCK